MPREVVVGTSDHGAGDGAEMPQERPALSFVAAHVHRMREALFKNSNSSSGSNNGNGHDSNGGGCAAHVRIPASDLARIATLADLLDQLQYWAVEEATTFVAEPSRLAETEAPEVVVACACSDRPRLIAQALTVVQQLLWHPQSASEVRRLLRGVQRYHNANNIRREEASGDPVLLFLAEVMAVHAGAVPLLVEAINTSTAVVQVLLRDVAQGEIPDSTQRRVTDIVDVLCTTPLVFCVETAMQRFSTNVTVQVAGVGLLATLVDLPPLLDPSIEEEPVGETSLADIVAHSDGLLVVLLAALHRHRHHLTLCRGVLHVWCVAGQSPRCRLPLLRHGAYGATLRLLKEFGAYTMDVFNAAAEMVGYFVPLLDALQRRSLVLTLHTLLLHRPQLEMVELVLALLVAVLSAHERRRGGEAAQTEAARRDPYAMYALCPQPPGIVSSAPALPVVHSVSDSIPPPRPRRHVRLQLSPTYWQPAASSKSTDDTWRFMLQQCAMPQLVSGVRDYLLSCESVDDEDAAHVHRVCALADAVLSFF